MAIDPEELRRTAAASRKNIDAEYERKYGAARQAELAAESKRRDAQGAQQRYDEERSKLEEMNPQRAAERLMQRAASEGKTAANLVLGEYNDDKLEYYGSDRPSRRAATDVAQQTADSLNAIPGVRARVEVQDGTKTSKFHDWPNRNSSVEVPTKKVIVHVDVDPK